MNLVVVSKKVVDGRPSPAMTGWARWVNRFATWYQSFRRLVPEAADSECDHRGEARRGWGGGRVAHCGGKTPASWDAAGWSAGALGGARMMLGGSPLSPTLPHEGGGSRFDQIGVHAFASQACVEGSSFGPTSARTRAW